MEASGFPWQLLPQICLQKLVPEPWVVPLYEAELAFLWGSVGQSLSLYLCEKSGEGGVTSRNVSHSTKEIWVQGARCSHCGFSPWCAEDLDWGALAQPLQRRSQSCCWRSVSQWCCSCSQKFVVQILILSGKRIRDIFLGCLFSPLYTHPAAASRGKKGDGKFVKLGCVNYADAMLGRRVGCGKRA